VSVVVVLPAPLRELVGGESTVKLEGAPATVGEALEALRAEHATVYHRLLTEQGELRPHVNVFVGTESIRHTGGLDTPLSPDSEVIVLPSVSGG
jgi:molybdopterin converting factor small subunit